jgi:hypothetical protein
MQHNQFGLFNRKEDEIMAWIPPVNIFRQITQPKAPTQPNLITPEELERRKRLLAQRAITDNRNVLTHPKVQTQSQINQLQSVAPPISASTPTINKVAITPPTAPTDNITDTVGNDPLYDIINDPNYRGISAYYADNNLDTTTLKPATQTTPQATPQATNTNQYVGGNDPTYDIIYDPNYRGPSAYAYEQANPEEKMQGYTIPTTPTLTPEQQINQKQRDNIINMLRYQQQQISQQALAEQNATSNQAQIQAKNFAEYLAQRGLNAPGATSGIDTQYRMTNDAATRQALNNIELQKQAQLQALDLQTQQNLTNLDIADFQLQQQQEAQDKQDKDKAIVDDKNSWLDTYKLRFYDPTGKSGGYMGEIDRIKAVVAKGDTSEAWKIPYLEAARTEKLLGQAEAAAKAEETATKNYNSKLERERKNALNVWKAMGVANKWVAKILGIAVGQKTVAYINAELANDRLALSKYIASQKKYSKSSSGGSGSAKADLSDSEARQLSEGYRDRLTGGKIESMTDLSEEVKVKVFDYISSLGAKSSYKPVLFQSLTGGSYSAYASKKSNYQTQVSKVNSLSGKALAERVKAITQTNSTYYKNLLGSYYYGKLLTVINNK